MAVLGLLFSIATNAERISINVYLKLKADNQVTPLIQHFNHFLDQQQIISTYQITPFQKEHPLHITLYLTSYQKNQLKEIKRKISILAQQEHPLIISTKQFIPSPNGYVMLSLKTSEKVQRLSNKVLFMLTGLRDRHTPIPAWAAKDRARVALFKQYGSPGVLHYFKPHFSVMDPKHLQMGQQQQLYQQLRILIADFKQKYPTQVWAQANAIAIGIADAQGQITQQLAEFPLS